MRLINIGPENESREYKRTTSELKKHVMRHIVKLNLKLKKVVSRLSFIEKGDLDGYLIKMV